MLEETSSSHADIALADFQSALVHSAAMREALAIRGLEQAADTLVASPPKRDDSTNLVLAQLLEEMQAIP